MTVAELINQLQQFRPDARVEIELKTYDGIGIQHSTYVNAIEVVQYVGSNGPTVTIVAEDD